MGSDPSGFPVRVEGQWGPDPTPGGPIPPGATGDLPGRSERREENEERRKTMLRSPDKDEVIVDLPSDDHRYYPYPKEVVFRGATTLLRAMGFVITYSSLEKGRILTYIGNTGVDGYFHVKLIGTRNVTFVHVNTGIRSLSGPGHIRNSKRRFFWLLDEWLHSWDGGHHRPLPSDPADSPRHGRNHGSSTLPSLWA